MQRWTDDDEEDGRAPRAPPPWLTWSHPSFEPLHVSTAAFYVYPIPLQRIGPFSRVRRTYIIQQIIPPSPTCPPTPLPSPPQRQRPSAANWLAPVLTPLVSASCWSWAVAVSPSGSDNKWRYSAWGWLTLVTRQLGFEKKNVEESLRENKGDK